MPAQQSPAPETAAFPLPKSMCGTCRGWGRAGSNMSAPGSCINSVHQHLSLCQLIVSRWCLSSELVFKAFKVTFIKFPPGWELMHLSCRQSSETDSLAWHSTANCFAKSRRPLSKKSLVFIDSPASRPMRCGEGRALVCAGLPCPCRREIGPCSVFQPLMSKDWAVCSLGTSPAWTHRGKVGG